MNYLKPDIYSEILKFYATGNTPINGNAFYSQMECSNSSEELQPHRQGDENNV